MKRTERISVGLTKPEKAIIRGRAAEAHLTMSAYIRNLVLAERRQQYIPTSNPTIRLNRPPKPPQQTMTERLIVQELKDVFSQGIEIHFKKYDHKPTDNIGEKALSIIREKEIQLLKEVDLLKEVEIK